MASETGPTPDTVAALASLEASAHSFDFFEALRLVECAWRDMPRLGTAARPAHEPIRIGQMPTLHFPATMLAQATRRADGRLAIQQYFLGLFGPQGPLPLHLTEHVHDRMTNGRDRTFAAFTDLFHHRVLELFYRAWANVRPTVHFDRPDKDAFVHYIGALIGIGMPELQQRDAFPDRTKLFFSGILAGGTKPREGLEALLQEYLQLPVQVQECVGQWLSISSPDLTRLGADRSCATLGGSAMLGESVWSAQHKLRIVVGPIAIGELMQYLPGSASLERLGALVLNYIGFEYAWDVQFRVRRQRLPGIQLGSLGHLGWTSWLAPASGGTAVDDFVIIMPEPNSGSA